MTEHRPTPSQEQDDEAFAARFREGWGRPQLDAIQAAAFDARLEARRHARQRPFRAVPAFVGAAVVAAMVSVVWVSHSERGDDEGFLASLAEAEAVAAADVVGDDTDVDDVAWADVAGTPSAERDDAAREGLGGELSGEYQALAVWMFPAVDDASEETDE